MSLVCFCVVLQPEDADRRPPPPVDIPLEEADYEFFSKPGRDMSFLSERWDICFSHTSDFPQRREQLWDKSILHDFHDLQLFAVYLAWLNAPWSVKYARKCILYGFPCEMNFSHHLSPNPTRVASDSVGFGDSWWEKSISHGKPYKIHIHIQCSTSCQWCRN